MEEILFFAGGARRPRAAPSASSRCATRFYGVLALIVHLFSLAVLFLLLSSAFVAAAQVVVYAGAVMVLYVFVVAYVGGAEESAWEPIPGQRFLAPLLGAALFVELSIAVLGSSLLALGTDGPDVKAGLRRPGRRSAACCSNDSCCPSRPRRSCSCWRQSALWCWRSPQARSSRRERRVVHRPLALLFAIGATGILSGAARS